MGAGSALGAGAGADTALADLRTAGFLRFGAACFAGMRRCTGMCRWIGALPSGVNCPCPEVSCANAGQPTSAAPARTMTARRKFSCKLNPMPFAETRRR